MRTTPPIPDARGPRSKVRDFTRWQSPEVIAERKVLDYDPRHPGGKILIGALGPKLVGIEDNRHILTVAGSRAGKSVTLINNLLFYRGSVLATDPKAELANITAARRAALGSGDPRR